MSDTRPTSSNNGHEEECPGEVTQEGSKPNVGQTEERRSAVQKGCEHELRTITDCPAQGKDSASVP